MVTSEKKCGKRGVQDRRAGDFGVRLAAVLVSGRIKIYGLRYDFSGWAGCWEESSY